MSFQRKGFVEGSKYVVEERLVGGRLLVHCFGDEYNKRVIPIGAWFKNKLYSGDKPTENIYNGTNFRPFPNSILTCIRADAIILEFSGLFNLEDSIDECLGFKEGMFYIYNRIEGDGRIIVTADGTGEELVIPKGVLFQDDTMVGEYRIYDGSNCLPVNRLCCISTDEDLIFQGSFSKFDYSLNEKLDEAGCNVCPNCRSTLDNGKKGDYSIFHKKGIVLPKDYDGGSKIRFCRHCGYINITVDDSISEITIHGNPSRYWALQDKVEESEVTDSKETE